MTVVFVGNGFEYSVSGTGVEPTSGVVSPSAGTTSLNLSSRSTWKQTDGTMYKRKGKTRTTKADEYILAHDLDKKAPRNISVARLKWFSVGKKVYKINRLELNLSLIHI